MEGIEKRNKGKRTSEKNGERDGNCERRRASEKIKR